MTDPAPHTNVLDYRTSIDHLDSSFLSLLAERVRVIEKIIYIKKRDNIDLDRSEARKEDMRKLIEISSHVQLGVDFLRTLLDLVFRDALQYQPAKTATGLEQVCKTLQLDDLRVTLKNLDWSICLILAERFSTVKRIGQCKRELNIPPLDRQRWRVVLESKMEKAKSLGINVQLVKDIFNTIHQVALMLETNAEQIN